MGIWTMVRKKDGLVSVHFKGNGTTVKCGEAAANERTLVAWAVDHGMAGDLINLFGRPYVVHNPKVPVQA